MKSIAKKRLKEKLSSDPTVASKRSCCSTGCLSLSCSTGSMTMSCSKETYSASCPRPTEWNCSDQTAAESSLSCCCWTGSTRTSCSKGCWSSARNWSTLSTSSSCCSGLPSVRCCWCLYSVLLWSSWKTTMKASGCSRMVVDLTAAEPTSDSVTCSAVQPGFAIGPGSCYSMCWALPLNFEQARNQRSSPVPCLICTGSSSFVTPSDVSDLVPAQRSARSRGRQTNVW